MQVKQINEEILSIFIPTQIKKKSGYATVILPGDKEHQTNHLPSNYNEKLVKAFVRAYKWKMMLKNKKVNSLNEIAKIENTDKAYIAKLFKLNYIAPDIIEAVLNGGQPENLNLRDFTHKTIPDLWSEQREIFGFASQI